MDAIDILGSLLGHKSSRAGKGTDILNDILKGGVRPETRSRPTPSSSAAPRPGDIEREAKELEDLLNVANGRAAGRQPRQPSPTPAPQRPRSDVATQPDFGRDARSVHPPSDVEVSQDERARVLVRAMVNAAKSDGQIDKSEQQSILARLGDTSREAIDFLQEEFAKPLDVREFAWSVPIGMEQQVYSLSLIAIDLDTSREAKYLQELAHGLRIPETVREQIHQRLGASQNRI